MNMTAPIQERATLVSLSISQWTARKRDKKVTGAAQQQFAAGHDAGNFNKQLIGKHALDRITQIVSSARGYHYQNTLSWGDNGDRIMSGALMMGFGQTMQQYEDEFYQRVGELENEYPRLVQQARNFLGAMYDPEDYPASITEKFRFKVSYTPLSTADDFRVSLSTEHVDSIKRKIAQDYQDRQRAALRECYERAREIVQTIHGQTADKDRRIFDSSIANAQAFVRLLPSLNLFGDPDLTTLGQDIEKLLVPADRLRQDDHLRATTAKAADALLARLPWK
jgi:hypothetical protein